MFFVIGGIEALLIRLQLAGPNANVLTASQYNTMFTMHGTTMVFLVGMPLAVAFGNYFIPLQIGARDVAFPRLNMFGYWIVLFGGLFIYSGFLLGGAPNGGWFGYAPLTSSPLSTGALPGHGPDFWVVGIIFLGIGSTTSAINFIVTVLNMRTPGMTLMRMPVFTWMMLVVAFLTAFAMPIITAAMIMVFFDRNFDTTFFLATKGGDPLLYQHLFWLFGHPEVYILILPSMGIISEVLPVFSRKPLFGYSVVVFSGIAIGFLGWGVWAHHMFATGLGPVAISAFGLSTMLIAVPTGVKIFNWLGTVYGGAVKLTTAMLFALGFIAMFTLGGLSGVLHSIVPVRHPADRHLLRRRALPLRAVRRDDARDLLGLLLLVAEDLRADARRAAREVELLVDADRLQPHVLPDAHRRPDRDAAAHLHLRRRPRLDHAQPDRDGRRLRRSRSRSWCSS